MRAEVENAAILTYLRQLITAHSTGRSPSGSVYSLLPTPICTGVLFFFSAANRTVKAGDKRRQAGCHGGEIHTDGLDRLTDRG